MSFNTDYNFQHCSPVHLLSLLKSHKILVNLGKYLILGSNSSLWSQYQARLMWDHAMSSASSDVTVCFARLAAHISWRNEDLRKSFSPHPKAPEHCVVAFFLLGNSNPTGKGNKNKYLDYCFPFYTTCYGSGFKTPHRRWGLSYFSSSLAFSCPHLLASASSESWGPQIACSTRHARLYPI